MSTSNITPEKFRACFNNAPNFDGMPDANAWLAKFRDLAPASQSRVLLNMLRDYNEFSAGKRSDPLHNGSRQRSQGVPGAAIGNGVTQIGPWGMATLSAGCDDTGQHGKRARTGRGAGTVADFA